MYNVVMIGKIITASILIIALIVSDHIEHDDRIQKPYTTIIELILFFMFVLSAVFLA